MNLERRNQVDTGSRTIDFSWYVHQTEGHREHPGTSTGFREDYLPPACAERRQEVGQGHHREGTMQRHNPLQDFLGLPSASEFSILLSFFFKCSMLELLGLGPVWPSFCGWLVWVRCLIQPIGRLSVAVVAQDVGNDMAVDIATLMGVDGATVASGNNSLHKGCFGLGGFNISIFRGWIFFPHWLEVIFSVLRLALLTSQVFLWMHG